MENKVAQFAATPDPTFGHKPQPRKISRSGRKAAEQNPEQADLRLVIEEDEATGSLVYRTIDRRTGEVVLQLGPEEIVKLVDETEYVAATVIRANA